MTEVFASASTNAVIPETNRSASLERFVGE
jgi:hypothetical protein